MSVVSAPRHPARPVRRSPRRRRLLRVLVWVVVALLVLALVAVLGVGWYFSGRALAVGSSGQAELSVRADGPGRAALSREGYAEFVGQHGVRVLAGATAEEAGTGDAEPPRPR